MKDFKDIVENSLYTIEKEKKELKNSTITDVFWLNFLFLLYFHKHKINHPKIKKLIKGERVRPDKINDGSADFVLTVKLLKERGIITESQMNLLTRFFAKLKQPNFDIDFDKLATTIKPMKGLVKECSEKFKPVIRNILESDFKMLDNYIPDIYRLSKLKYPKSEMFLLVKRLGLKFDKDNGMGNTLDKTMVKNDTTDKEQKALNKHLNPKPVPKQDELYEKVKIMLNRIYDGERINEKPREFYIACSYILMNTFNMDLNDNDIIKTQKGFKEATQYKPMLDKEGFNKEVDKNTVSYILYDYVKGDIVYSIFNSYIYETYDSFSKYVVNMIDNKKFSDFFKKIFADKKYFSEEKLKKCFFNEIPKGKDYKIEINKYVAVVYKNIKYMLQGFGKDITGKFLLDINFYIFSVNYGDFLNVFLKSLKQLGFDKEVEKIMQYFVEKNTSFISKLDVEIDNEDLFNKLFKKLKDEIWGNEYYVIDKLPFYNKNYFSKLTQNFTNKDRIEKIEKALLNRLETFNSQYRYYNLKFLLFVTNVFNYFNDLSKLKGNIPENDNYKNIFYYTNYSSITVYDLTNEEFEKLEALFSESEMLEQFKDFVHTFSGTYLDILSNAKNYDFIERYFQKYLTTVFTIFRNNFTNYCVSNIAKLVYKFKNNSLKSQLTNFLLNTYKEEMLDNPLYSPITATEEYSGQIDAFLRDTIKYISKTLNQETLKKFLRDLFYFIDDYDTNDFKNFFYDIRQYYYLRTYLSVIIPQQKLDDIMNASLSNPNLSQKIVDIIFQNYLETNIGIKEVKDKKEFIEMFFNKYKENFSPLITEQIVNYPYDTVLKVLNNKNIDIDDRIKNEIMNAYLNNNIVNLGFNAKSYDPFSIKVYKASDFGKNIPSSKTFIKYLNRLIEYDNTGKEKRKYLSFVLKDDDICNKILEIVEKNDNGTELFDTFVEKLTNSAKAGLTQKLKRHIILKPVLDKVFNDTEGIKIEKKLNKEDMTKILKFNNFDFFDEIKVGRKKKKEKYSEFIQRIKKEVLSNIDKYENLKDKIRFKGNYVNWAQEEKDKKEVELLDYYNDKHGPTAMKILEVYEMEDNMTDEMKEFIKKYPEPVLYPAFHGTNDVAASMIARFGFKVVDKSLPGVQTTGKMLGNGVYVTNVIPKALQYVGDGYARRTGRTGYIFECKVYLGEKGENYSAAGLGNDSIRSPEWCVYDPRAQIKILKMYKVQIVNKKEILAKKKKIEEGHKVMKFKEFISEEKLNKRATFFFYDGEIPNEKGELISFVEWFKKYGSKKVFFTPSQKGPVVVILNNITYDTFHIPNSVEFIGNNPEKLYTLFRKLMGWKKIKK